MARKATDLLDVFRFNSEEDGHESKGRRKSAASAASAARKAAKRSARSDGSASAGAGRQASGAFNEGVHLSSRQVVLASCAGLLLLVLSFTLGLATGRPDGAPTLEPALTRQTQIVVRGSLPLIDPASRKEADIERIRRALVDDFRVPERSLRIWKEGGRIILQVGPFRDETHARNYLRTSGLQIAEFNMEDPFLSPRFVSYP